MIIIDRLDKFNEVIEYYKKVLDSAEKIKRFKTIDEYSNYFSELNSDENYYPAIKGLIMGNSLMILRSEEEINNSNIDEEFEKSINHSSDDYNFLKNIEVLEKSIDEKEKLRQIRNCLAHSMYEIRIMDPNKTTTDDTLDNVRIYLNNGKIRGEISYLEFYHLTSFYKNSLEKNIFKIDSDFAKLDTTNPNGDNFEKSVNTFVNSICVNGEKIDKDKKAFLKKYLHYLGPSNLNSLDGLHSVLQVIANINGYSLSVGSIIDDFGNRYIEMIRHMKSINDSGMAHPLLSLTKEYVLKREFESHKCKLPLIYASLLTGIASYNLLYAREVNKYTENPIFEYKNIDLELVKGKIQSKGKTIEKINPYTKTENKLKYYQSQISKLENDITALQRTIEVCSNPQNKNPQKEYIKKSAIQQINEKEEKLKQIKVEADKIEESLKNTPKEEYENSSEFFRHLRNSLAHNFYEINYKKFFNTRKLGDISFTFKDYELGDTERKKPIFELSVNADELKQILDNFQNQVNKSIQESCQGEENKKRYLNEALIKRGFDPSVFEDLNSTKAKENITYGEL